MKRFILFFLWFLPFVLLGNQPELTPHDARVKIDEILRTHATQHTLNQELVARALINFFQELDPNYTYLIESDILKWIKPSRELLNIILEQIQGEQFTAFEEMYR